MTPRFRLPKIIGLAITAGLTACATPPVQSLAPARTSESPAAIEVNVARRVLAVHFQPGSVTPSPGQTEALNVLIGAGDVGRGDRILVERGPAVLDDARARVLVAALSREGLRPLVTENGDVAEGELRLIVEHAVAQVRGCPNWSKPPGNDFANTLHSDFGCATAAVLAAMVADPRDLVEGRPLAPVVGDAAVLAIHRYRVGAPEATDATARVFFPDGETTTATAPTKAQAAPAAAAPAAPAGALAQAAAALTGTGPPR